MIENVYECLVTSYGGIDYVRDDEEEIESKAVAKVSIKGSLDIVLLGECGKSGRRHLGPCWII